MTRESQGLWNKKNKYAIRKFSVGAASIVIGSLLFLSIGNQAQAAENTSDVISTNSNEKNSENNPTHTELLDTSSNKGVISEGAQTRNNVIKDKIDTNESCYNGENPTAKGVGVNPENGVFVDWKTSFNTGDFSGAVTNSKTLEHVYDLNGTTPEEVAKMFPGGEADAGTVKYTWEEKTFKSNEEYDGWQLTNDSIGKTFTIVQPEMNQQIVKGTSDKEFKPEKTKVYNNPLGQDAVASTGEKLTSLTGTANWKTNSANRYRTTDGPEVPVRYIELGVMGTKVKSREIKVNPDSLVRFHFFYRGVYGTNEDAYKLSEQGIGYLIDSKTGGKLSNLAKNNELSIDSGYFGWTFASSIYKIPSNVESINIVLEAGDMPKSYVKNYPDINNPGYLFDNVGLELGVALDSKQTLTRVSSDGKSEDNYFTQDKIYKRGDILKYTLETVNNGFINSNDNLTFIKVPEGLTIKSELPDGYKYDETTRTITVSNRMLDKNISKINIEFQVDNDIKKMVLILNHILILIL